jgi:hypothetical protein
VVLVIVVADDVVIEVALIVVVVLLRQREKPVSHVPAGFFLAYGTHTKGSLSLMHGPAVPKAHRLSPQSNGETGVGIAVGDIVGNCVMVMFSPKHS